MAEIRPFGGIHYNPSSVKDLTRVLCPPYDVISPVQQQEFYLRSDNNFVRIEFGRELPRDSDNDNKYTRASVTLKNWLEKGILQKDSQPGVYIHDHYYTYSGKEYRRRHIVCLVKLEEWDRMVIRPHEGTFTRAKSDRLSMLWALQTNTSPILGLYNDDNSITDLLESQTDLEPLLQVKYDDGESHSVRVIRDESTITGLSQSFKQLPLYIADGHHRYESALTYRRERRFGSPPGSGEEPYDFVLMSLVEFKDPGLLILPAHRLLRGVSKSNLSDLSHGLESYFIVSEIPENDYAIDDPVKVLQENTRDAVNIILAGLIPEHNLHLRLRDDITLNRLLPRLHADYNQKLGVSVVDHLILEGIMGFTPEAIGSLLSYTHDAAEAIHLVSSQEYQLAFLVNPVKPSDIKSVADSGDRMPKKSTYFYPKMPAGLVFYSFAE